MKQMEHIVHAKWIVTGEKEQRVLEDHALIIDRGIIQDILPSSDAKAQYQATRIDEYPYHAVMPGLINAHTHLGMNYFRGLGCDLMLMDWLNQYIWPAEKKWLAHDFVKDVSLFSMAEMIRGGTTCFNDMFYFLQATAEATEIAGLRGCIGMTVIEFPTPWAQTTDEYFDKGLEFYEQYKDHDFITPTFAPHAPYTVSDASFSRIKELSDKLDIKINLHLHETQTEIDQSMTEYQKRPIKRLHDLGLLSPQLLAVHTTQLNAEDLDILSQTKPHVIHCPESNMKLASGICPVDPLKELGINIALGTDSVASNNDLNMISEMRTATFLSKVSTLNPISCNADDTLELATLNGAKALGMDHFIGSLKKGKAADFIAINLDEIETLPVFDPVVQTIYSSSRQQVSDVWVAGRQLMKDRQLLTLNEAELKEKARRWRV
ncbi:MAG: TRZ/ATZ family hydrolase [Gammaproteobacteria bacterium]|nr:TRZ/ATZ family hydrolase [Gammaproteobacteria bacterium]